MGCTDLKRGLACPICYERCKARLDDPDTPDAECECREDCPICVAKSIFKSRSFSRNKDCWYCYGHGGITKLLPKFAKGDRVLFRFKVCADCGPCKNRIAGSNKFKTGETWFTQWFTGKIKGNSKTDWTGKPFYAIAPEKNQPLGSAQICKKEITGCRSVYVDNIVFHTSDNMGLALNDVGPAAASPVAGTTDDSFDEEKQIDKPVPVPSSPPALSGLDAALVNSAKFGFGDSPERRRLQILIKRFQKVSLQCQGYSN